MKRYVQAMLPPTWRDYTGNPLVQNSHIDQSSSLRQAPRDVSEMVRGSLEVRVVRDDAVIATELADNAESDGFAG